MKLEKFWFNAQQAGSNSLPMVANFGIGVTAYNISDALVLLETVFKKKADGLIWKKITSLNELDASHVLPNIGNPLTRGIWFPNGL
jgi:hypothetical protein